MKVKTYIPESLEIESNRQQSYVRTFEPDLHITKYPNATLLPSNGWGNFLGGVMDVSGNCVPYSAWMQGCEGKYDYDNSNVRIIHDEVIYLGTLNNGWGHALTDNFRHAWIWYSKEGRLLLQSHPKIVYMTVDNTDLKPYAQKLYELAGCDVSAATKVDCITRYDAVYVPSDCIINVKYGFLWSDSYKFLIDHIKLTVAKMESKKYPAKIYLTRSLLPQSTRDIGEPSIEKIFRNLGYTIIAPEKHTVIEQIQMMLQCKSLVATEGSVAHTSIFCCEGTEVVCLLKIPAFNPYQYMINDMAHLKVTYVNVQQSFRLSKKEAEWCWGPFYMLRTNELVQYAVDHALYIKQSVPKLSIYYWMYKFPILAKIGHKIRLLTSKIYTYIQ